MNENPKVFISYSHDSPEHREWVRKLAEGLMRNGIDTILDQWDLRLGANLPRFMENSLVKSDRVLVVCTDTYLEKSGEGVGGVGYETTILTAELIQDQRTTKFIPIVRNVALQRKTPLCLAGRVYIDFSVDSEYDTALNRLIHEIYGVDQKPKPKLGKNPFGSDDQGPPQLEEDSTVFFYNRFCSAFPGVRGISWFESEVAVDRLMILLKEPLVFQRVTPIWWWRRGNGGIDGVTRFDRDQILLNYEEMGIRRIAAVPSSSYHETFVYVEVHPEPPTGLNDVDIEGAVECSGFSREEYAVFGDREISRPEYDDGAAVIDGRPVDLCGKAELRARFLSPYNFLIAPFSSPINNMSFDRRRNTILNEILKGDRTLEALAREVRDLPRRSIEHELP
jgi:hypothetical protein